MTDDLRLTILYEDGEDGWIVSRIAEVPGAISQGRTREEARENVLDALRELTLSYLDDPPPPSAASSEPVTVTLTR